MIDKTPKGKPALRLYESQLIDLLNSQAAQAARENDTAKILALYPAFDLIYSYLAKQTTGPELAELLSDHSNDQWTFNPADDANPYPTFSVALTTPLHGSRTTGSDGNFPWTMPF